MNSICSWALGAGLEVFSRLFLICILPSVVLGLMSNPPVLGLADLLYPGGCFAETCQGVPHVALWGVLHKLAGPLVF